MFYKLNSNWFIKKVTVRLIYNKNNMKYWSPDTKLKWSIGLSSGVRGWWSPSPWPRCCRSACWFTACGHVAAQRRCASLSGEPTPTFCWTTSTEPLHVPEETQGNRGKGVSDWTSRTLRMKSGRRHTQGGRSCREDEEWGRSVIAQRETTQRNLFNLIPSTDLLKWS